MTSEEMIPLVRFLLILTAYLLLPVYGVWIACGLLADRYAQAPIRALTAENEQ